MKFFTKGLFTILFACVIGQSALFAQTLQVTAPTASTVWCAGSNHNITWTSSGVNTIRIEASQDGTNYLPVQTTIDASTGSYNFAVPSNFPAGNQYRIRLVDINDPTITSTSDAFTLSGNTTITTQPASQVVCMGQSGILTVGTTGANLTYQWYKNGSMINGATTSTYNLQGVPGVEGSYTVTVIGACGTSQTSSAAEVSISRMPAINTHPLTQNAAPGASVTFSVIASDAVTYQWKKDGQNIIGNSASITLNNIQSTDAGDYQVVVSNSCGNVSSNIAKLTVGSGGVGAVMLVDPTLDFGTIQPGGSIEKMLAVRNTGDVALNVTGVTISGGEAQSFLIMGGNAPFTVAPNETHNITIRFFGNNNGNYTSTVSFTSNANFASTVTLNGKIATAGSGVLTVASTLDFGTIDLSGTSEKSLVLSNTGSAPLSVTGITMGGTNASSFSIVNTPTFPITIAAGANLFIPVKFTSGVAGSYTATATITSNGGNSTVTLSGVVSATGGSKLSIASVVSFGQTLINATGTKTVTISNTGTTPVMVNAISFEGTNASLFSLPTAFTPQSIAAGGTLDVVVNFKPTAEVTANAVMRITAADGEIKTNLTGLGVLQLSVNNNLAGYINAMNVMPNPATEKAVISVTLSKNTMAEVQVSDMTGRIIRTLQPLQMIEAGSRSFVWNMHNDAGEKASAGMYRIIMRGADGIVTIPVVIIE